MNWEFTGETKEFHDITLRRIRARFDFCLKCGIKIRKGKLGGWIEKDSNLSGDAWVSGDAKVYGNAKVCEYAWVSGKAEVYCDAWVHGDAKVPGNAEVYGDANVHGNAKVCEYAKVSGNAEVYGDAWVHGDAEIRSTCDYSVYKNTWSSFRWFTYTRSNKKWTVGCFYGSGDELIKKAYEDSELSGRCYEAIVKCQREIDAQLEKTNEET